MTEIERKALALVNEVREGPRRTPWRTSSREYDNLIEALCLAIERDEAFRQEVSDVVVEHLRMTDERCSSLWRRVTRDNLSRFIIPKSDPLVEAVKEANAEKRANVEDWTDHLRAAMKARGYEWTKIVEDR